MISKIKEVSRPNLQNRIKPLFVLQFLLVSAAFFMWFYFKGTPSYEKYNAIGDLLVGNMFLLMVIESYLLNEMNKNKCFSILLAAIVFITQGIYFVLF